MRRRVRVLPRFPIRLLCERTPRDFAKPSMRLAVGFIGSILSCQTPAWTNRREDIPQRSRSHSFLAQPGWAASQDDRTNRALTRGPENRPRGCRHKIMNKQQVWRPINFSPISKSCSKDPFVRQKTATPYRLNSFQNAQIRASQDSSGWRSARALNGKRTGGIAAARHDRTHGRMQFRSRFPAKVANMILHQNFDGTRSASADHRRCLPAGCALETVAPVRPVLPNSSLDVLAFVGSCLANLSAGFRR